MKGKNKLVPRLLGVTKDSVLRLDEKTKEILKTWPLTTVRRWGASPNTFTLDFGDYSDQYYSVQTTEAEQILQLIAGYIDIILKKVNIFISSQLTRSLRQKILKTLRCSNIFFVCLPLGPGGTSCNILWRQSSWALHICTNFWLFIHLQLELCIYLQGFYMCILRDIAFGPGSTSLHHQGRGLGWPTPHQGHSQCQSRLIHIPFRVISQWFTGDFKHEMSSLCVPLYI